MNFCQNCKWGHNIKKSWVTSPPVEEVMNYIVMTCRRFPPNDKGEFPEIKADYWCGEFASKYSSPEEPSSYV